MACAALTRQGRRPWAARGHSTRQAPAATLHSPTHARSAAKPPVILHHFDASPFAEKIRLILGFRGLAWLGVQIPMVLPKPDVVALSGGYRKTPLLQIGASVYADTP